MGLFSAVSIGVGGMVGGGIFAVLGLAVLLGGGGTPFAFLLGGIIVLLTCYSYSKLSSHFLCEGGTVSFIHRIFKNPWLGSFVNILLVVSYIIMLSLYAFAFGAYGAVFFPEYDYELVKHICICLGLILPALVNVLESHHIGKAEFIIVVIKIAILCAFVIFGSFNIDIAKASPARWPPILQLIEGGMIIFLAYEGFELISNTSEDIHEPKKNLKKAFFISAIFVILLYMAVSFITVCALSVQEIEKSKEYVLAEAAMPTLGSMGFKVIAIAALLATFSAINATLYGTARIIKRLAHFDHLPKVLSKETNKKPLISLFSLTVVALLTSNLLDLRSISAMGSSGFFIIFMCVNITCIIKRKELKANFFIPALGALMCLAAFCVLIYHTYSVDVKHLIALLALVLISAIIAFSYQVYLRTHTKS